MHKTGREQAGPSSTIIRMLFGFSFSRIGINFWSNNWSIVSVQLGRTCALIIAYARIKWVRIFIQRGAYSNSNSRTHSSETDGDDHEATKRNTDNGSLYQNVGQKTSPFDLFARLDSVPKETWKLCKSNKYNMLPVDYTFYSSKNYQAITFQWRNSGTTEVRSCQTSKQ